MSQISTIVVADIFERSGVSEKTGKPWKNWALVDGNGERYSTFEAGVAVPELKGKRVEVEWEQSGNFKNLLRATPVEEPPKPGTGEYIKGKEAPETQRNIRASVALENAVAWCIGNDDSRTTLSEHGVVLVAKVFYKGLKEMAEENPPGTKPSPSSEELPL